MICVDSTIALPIPKFRFAGAESRKAIVSPLVFDLSGGCPMEQLLALIVTVSSLVVLTLGIKAALQDTPYSLATAMASLVVLIGLFAIDPHNVDPLTMPCARVALMVGMLTTIFWLGGILDKAVKHATKSQADANAAIQTNLLPGYVNYQEAMFAPAKGSQAKLKLVAGDYDTSRSGYLRHNSILLPAAPGDGVKLNAEVETPLTALSALRSPTCIYREYLFSEVTDCAVAADGQPKSLTSVMTAGAATALIFGPLLALGAGTLFATRNEMALVALSFSDNKRALAHIKKVEVIKLQFALDRSATRGRQAVAPWNAASA